MGSRVKFLSVLAGVVLPAVLSVGPLTTLPASAAVSAVVSVTCPVTGTVVNVSSDCFYLKGHATATVPIVGGSGGFSVDAAGQTCSIASDSDAGSPFGCGTVTGSGTFTNTVCGTGSASGTFSIPGVAGGDGSASGSFTISFTAGQGTISSASGAVTETDPATDNDGTATNTATITGGTVALTPVAADVIAGVSGGNCVTGFNFEAKDVTLSD